MPSRRQPSHRWLLQSLWLLIAVVVWGLPSHAMASGAVVQSPICVSDAMTMWEETRATTDCDLRADHAAEPGAIPICGENAESTVAPPPIVHRVAGSISSCADPETDIDTDDGSPAQIEAAWSDGLSAGWFSAAAWPHAARLPDLARDHRASRRRTLDLSPDLRPPIAQR